jgi:hypothetical protein
LWSALLVIGAVIAGLVGSAQADPVLTPAANITHATPKVPVVIDGVRYEPEQIHKFDGRPLYLMVDLAKPNELVGFTEETAFTAASEAKIKAYEQQIGTSWYGDYAVIYSGDELRDNWERVNSGWGVNDLRAVARGCGIFGCDGDWNDVISSVEVHGHIHLYPNPQYTGGYLGVYGNGWLNLSPYGYDNIVSSLNVWF